jgi:hypothetical protein
VQVWQESLSRKNFLEFLKGFICFSENINYIGRTTEPYGKKFPIVAGIYYEDNYF